MYAAMFLFALGVSLVAFLPQLPDLHHLVLMLLAIPLVAIAPRTTPMLGLLLGFSYATYEGQRWIDQKLPLDAEGETVELTIRVLDTPEARGEHARFRAKVTEGEYSGRNVQLLWLEDNAPAKGGIWRLPVKLFRPRGSVNPGLFDYEAWLLSTRIHAVGYVMPNLSQARRLAGSEWQLIEGFRINVLRRLAVAQFSENVRGALAALLVGDSKQVPPSTWRDLSHTGTNHLFVVSGLHVGLVAAAVWFGLRRLPISSHLKLVTSGVLLVGYSLVVGFGLPVQRALVMTLIGLVVVAVRREIDVWKTLTVALCCSLLLNPFVFLNTGFWLSFGAVAGLIFGFRGRRVEFFVMPTLIRSQWVALLATAPLLLCWIGYFSMGSILANTVLVPLMGVFIVPLILSYLVLELFNVHWLASDMLELLSQVMALVLIFIAWVAEHSWVLSWPLAWDARLVLLLLGSLILLLPIGLLPRWLGLLFWLPVFTPLETKPGDYMRIDILDVGQGLSVIATTPESTLLFDAGPSFHRLDSGQRVVVPTLAKLGRNSLDLLITSHGDDDHAGGVASVKSMMPVLDARSSDPNYGADCRGGSKQLSQITVRWISVSDPNANRNDSSCLVFLEHKFGTVLLPGDIERSAERRLHHWLPKADLLVSPHHGSLSSSTPAFINKVAPKWVVHSAGHGNPFGHPHQIVVERYRNRGIRQLSTARSGAISFLFTSKEVSVQQARISERRFWYDAQSSNIAGNQRPL
jgi:competence protein ComEC